MKNGSSRNKTAALGKKSKTSTRILGPVADLERHVRSDWWRNIFNYLYLKTDADVVDDQNITSREIDLITEILNLSPEHHILDLACGQGRHTLELARRDYKNVEGLDRSHYLIQKAKARARKESLSVRLREGDARKIPGPPDDFDFVLILGNSFGYFETPNEDRKVLEEVLRILKPWAKLLVDVTDGEYMRSNFEPRSWEWIDKKYFVCRERSLAADNNRLISREVITHVEKGVVADQFYAERLYTKESLRDLLQQVGFTEINFHGELVPDSKRDQDLGMMKVRLIATAIAKKDWTPVKRKSREILKNIAVLLGDPNKPDPIKPFSRFDDDDLYTIDQLKSALHEKKEYKFIYLNDHDTFIQELSKLKGKIDYVFNLCDEGYNNDAKKELHVPSLLETLDMPYTGSGPQCLAFCYDKSLVRGIAKEMNIPTPEAFFIKPEDTTFELPFGFPVIVKPNFGDSSFGITQISVAHSIEELINAISEIRNRFGYDKPILVEEFLSGKDLSVGIIGNSPDSYKVLTIIEEDYSALPPELPRICGYEAKWMPDSPYWNIKSIPAELSDDVEKMLVECCLNLSERLECRDYCRFDWRLDSAGNPKLLEVNPNPGWCWDGHLAKMAGFDGIGYEKMIDMILQAAEARLFPQGMGDTKNGNLPSQ